MTGDRYRIAVVCLGNICRSPMAHVVLEQRLEEAGLGDAVVVTSAGTGDWHVGGPMDERAAATLSAAGYDPSRHRARQFDASWFEEADLVLVMDRANLRDVRGLVGERDDAAEVLERVRLFRSFDPREPDAEVPDPYFGGPEGFEEVLATVERTSDAIVTALRREVVDA